MTLSVYSVNLYKIPMYKVWVNHVSKTYCLELLTSYKVVGTTVMLFKRTPNAV